MLKKINIPTLFYMKRTLIYYRYFTGIEIIDPNLFRPDKTQSETDPKLIGTYMDPNFQESKDPDPTRPDMNPTRGSGCHA